MCLCVIVNYSDIQFQSAVHTNSAADHIVVQHYVSYKRHHASFHHRCLPTYKHIRLQDSTLCLSWPFESEWFKLRVHEKVEFHCSFIRLRCYLLMCMWYMHIYQSCSSILKFAQFVDCVCYCQVVHHRPEISKGQLDFGTLAMGEKRTMNFTLRNDNPVDVRSTCFELSYLFNPCTECCVRGPP